MHHLSAGLACEPLAASVPGFTFPLWCQLGTNGSKDTGALQRTGANGCQWPLWPINLATARGSNQRSTLRVPQTDPSSQTKQLRNETTPLRLCWSGDPVLTLPAVMATTLGKHRLPRSTWTLRRDVTTRQSQTHVTPDPHSADELQNTNLSCFICVASVLEVALSSWLVFLVYLQSWHHTHTHTHTHYGTLENHATVDIRAISARDRVFCQSGGVVFDVVGGCRCIIMILDSYMHRQRPF